MPTAGYFDSNECQYDVDGQYGSAVADMSAYREFAGTVLWQLPGVRQTRTYAVMEEVKNSTQLPLR